MLMYKLKQDKDKSPPFASCYVPAWTVCSDTPESSLGKLRWPPGPTGAGSGYKTKPREVTCTFGTCWGRRAGALAHGPAGSLLSYCSEAPALPWLLGPEVAGHSSLHSSQKETSLETRNKEQISPSFLDLIPTSPFQHPRVAAVFLEGSLPHTSAAVKADWLSAGTATRKARGWGADLPRKANGAWLGLCEMPIKPSSPDAFNCLIPKWS